MKLTSYGAALEVTGSQHLLEVNGKKILMDCGLFQGHRKIAFEKSLMPILIILAIYRI
jgi:metallo-beta-lactamase family protein